MNEALPFVALLAKECKTIYAQKGEDSRKVVTREEREHTGVRKLNSNADGLCRSLGPWPWRNQKHWWGWLFPPSTWTCRFLVMLAKNWEVSFFWSHFFLVESEMGFASNSIHTGKPSSDIIMREMLRSISRWSRITHYFRKKIDLDWWKKLIVGWVGILYTKKYLASTLCQF